MKTEAERFVNDIDHIWVAYSFFEQAIPDVTEDNLPLRCGQLEFRHTSQIESVRVELGWAFFTRLEACLESLLHRVNIELTKKKSLLAVCKSYGLILSDHEERGLRSYRELRNVLHHADGNPATYDRELCEIVAIDGQEPHLYKTEVKGFYDLFKKVGTFLANASESSR